MRSDEVGNETPEAMNQKEIDVGIYDTEGELIYLKKHPFSDGESSLTITVDQPSTQAGIDPLHKLIDKRPEDNLMGVSDATLQQRLQGGVDKALEAALIEVVPGVDPVAEI